MNAVKPVQQILPPPPPHMVGDGFRVHNFFPGGYNMDLRRMSPFFLLDYNAKIEFPPKDTPRGVGVHPHRGFETVTIAYHGKIAHHDSAGNSGIIAGGDVQWMTAGSGVLHKEYHEKEYSRKGGAFQMVQMWVNLPAKYKMTPPKYQAITKDQMGVAELPHNGGTVEVLAGEYGGVKGPAFTFTPMQVYHVRLNKGTDVVLSFPQNYNTGLLVVEGSVQVNNSQTAPADNFVLFKNHGTDITLHAPENNLLLVLSGEPINEPIVPYGPFLMNTREEIMQAYRDLNDGKFGVLEE
ncbi:pirin family protein [Sphingobacteriales bacterium UPWRP_1]|nr:short-chain dehydrogenase [Sphingobacteriales bacterium TSM_CSS]PSJ73110.1 pirin family protein [Sphingobacteriales bacterium UPWRP_1]